MFKKMMIPALVLAAASVAVPAAASASASAQSYGHNQGPNRPPVASHNNWQSINQRQAQLDRRIDQGVRNGQLSRREATRLRSEFNSLARLETQYRRGGLSSRERNDLDRRFDRLEAQIRAERRDNDNRRGDARRH